VIILALNCGSSTVKLQALEGAPDDLAGGRARRIASALIERIGGEATARLSREGAPVVRDAGSVPDHAAAVRRAVQWAAMVLPGADAVAHRVVHGGQQFSRSVLVDAAVEDAIRALQTLAPLHNAPGLEGIRVCRDLLGRRMPMVAVFDTAFHAELPERAACYAIPHELAARHAVRRYGFHGIAYRSVLAAYARLTGVAPDRATLVALHLGGGCSAAAIRAGRSVDTSMGLTPLEGLVMGTRSGDLDPAVPGYLAHREGVSVGEVEQWLNERSGLLGLSGTSGDVRDLLAREAEDPRARTALDVFCYRARKYVGAYLAALGGADAVVFSGGIGERAVALRARICDGLEWCGLALDPGRNAHTVSGAGRISADGSRLAAWVIPADEEAVMAADAVACLEAARDSRA